MDALFGSIVAIKTVGCKASLKQKRVENDGDGDEDASGNDDDGATDSSTCTPKKRRKTEPDVAASRSKSSGEADAISSEKAEQVGGPGSSGKDKGGKDKVEKLKQSEARKRASELAKAGDSPNVCFRERVKHVTAVHTARQLITHVNNMVENLQDFHMLSRVGLKAYKDLQVKVEKALSADTIALYTIGSDDALSMVEAAGCTRKGAGMDVL